MRVFITGTESFVGQELVTQCDNSGIEVFGIDRQKPCDERFHQIDIRSPDVADVIPQNVDAIVHLASLSTDPLCRGRAYDCFDINVMGTLNLIDAVKAKDTRRFIFASSEWVYDSFIEDEIKNEDSVINIANHESEYALSKLVSEVNLKQAYLQGFCPVVILRFGIIYGPRKRNWSAVEALFNDLKTKEEVTVGSLKTGRCFIHVSDIASGIIKSMDIKEGFHIINLQGSRLITLGEIIETSKEILGKAPRVKEKDSGNASVRRVSGKLAKEVLGWEAKVNLEQGIRSLRGPV